MLSWAERHASRTADCRGFPGPGHLRCTKLPFLCCTTRKILHECYIIAHWRRNVSRCVLVRPRPIRLEGVEPSSQTTTVDQYLSAKEQWRYLTHLHMIEASYWPFEESATMSIRCRRSVHQCDALSLEIPQPVTLIGYRPFMKSSMFSDHHRN